MADIVASMPAVAVFGGGFIQFEAVDPTTGAAVSGVTVSATSISGIDLSPEDSAENPIKPPSTLTGAYTST